MTPPALHCLSPGWHSPEHAPAVHTYWQLSTTVAVTRSTPHSRRSVSVPLQKWEPAIWSLHSGTMGWHDPAFAPGVVSHSMLPPQVPFDCQVPSRHTSWPRCAWPTQAKAPFLSHATPKAPSAVPSMTMPPLLGVPPLPAVFSAPELPPAPASPWRPGLCTHALFTQLWSDRQSASEVHAVRQKA